MKEQQQTVPPHTSRGTTKAAQIVENAGVTITGSGTVDVAVRLVIAQLDTRLRKHFRLRPSRRSSRTRDRRRDSTECVCRQKVARATENYVRHDSRSGLGDMRWSTARRIRRRSRSSRRSRC